MKKAEKPKQQEEVVFTGGASSSHCPPYHLIPQPALQCMADTFQNGIDQKGKERAWNALSPNQECLSDREFLIERISHVLGHAMRLRDQLAAKQSIDPKDAGALMWAGALFACASAKEKEGVTG